MVLLSRLRLREKDCDTVSEIDDDEYWEPYLDVLETWYGLCESTVREATESWSGMVDNIEIWQAVESISSDSLSYILQKTWKYKYDAIRLLWNQEVEGYDEILFFNYLTTEQMSLLENFNPEGRDYEGKMVVNSWTGYPTLKEVKEEINPSWLPEDGSAPYAFDLYRAESYKPPASAVTNAKRGLELRKEYGRGGLSPAEAKSQGIDSGVTRARKIASGKVSKHDVRRMSAFNRHRKNYRPEKKMPAGGPTAGTIAWLLWGGTSGVNWAKKKSAAMNAEDYEIKSHIWINDNPRKYSYHRCGCGQKLHYVDEGYFECSSCSAIWDGEKYLGLDDVWNYCKNCGISFEEGGRDEICRGEAMNAESISGDPWDEGSVADEVYKLFQKHGNINYWSYRQDDGNMLFEVILDPNQTESSDFAAEDYNSFTEEMESLIDKYGKLESYDTQFYDNLMDVSFSFRPHNSDFDDVDFDAEERYRQDYMVPADVHKIMEAAIHLQKLHEQHEGSYPEWWKSKLSVVASELDNLVDVLDYKVDHPEEFDAEEITGDEDIKVGDVVRSYDFCLGGKVMNDDCYVEGIVEKIEPVEWCGPNCDHYHIKTIRRIFNGKPTTYEDYYFPVADPQQSAVRRVARWSAEDWGGDPEGILAKALSRARMRSKEPRKPLKIEKLPHPDQKSLKDFEAVIIPETSGYAEQAAATRMAIEESEQQQKLLELQTLLKLKILSPEDVFAMMLRE